MQVPVSLSMEAIVLQENFKAIPGWLVGLVASLIALIVFRRLGNKISGSESRLADTLVDIINLLSAASVVASISTTPFISSLTSSIQGHISSWQIAEGLVIGGAVVLGIAVAITAYIYTKTESKLWLFSFGIGIQVIAIFVPWMNTLLSWWINYPIAFLWNLIIDILSFLPSIVISF